MRVAVIAECFLPARNGVTNSVIRVVEHLERRGHEAVIIAPGIGPSTWSRTPVERVSGVGLPFYRDLSVGVPTKRLAAIVGAFSPEVVHLAAPAVLGAAGARVARRLDVPAVAVYQTDYAGFAVRYGAGSMAPWVWRVLRTVHRNTALTLAPSTAAAWQLQHRGIAPVAIWGRGVDLTAFHPSHRSDLLRRRLSRRGDVLVGYVGRLAREKRVELLAHARAPGTQLVVVGDGPDRRRLQRLLPDALFLGFRTGVELSQAIASLDVFVHTGADETFCQSVQEALAAGLPVVAPARGGPLDLVRHGENGFLYPPDDHGQLAGAVRRLVRDPALRARLGGAARTSVLGRDWDVIGDQLLEHYRAVTGTADRRARVA